MRCWLRGDGGAERINREKRSNGERGSQTGAEVTEGTKKSSPRRRGGHGRTWSGSVGQQLLTVQHVLQREFWNGPHEELRELSSLTNVKNALADVDWGSVGK